MKLKKVLSGILMSALLIGSIGSSGFAEQKTLDFKDSSEAKWASKHISKMACKDIIKGYNDGSFKPNKPVTHSEAVVLALKTAGYQDEIEKTTADSVYLPYSDAKSIPAWAKPAIALAETKGFIPSETSVNFQPNTPASREWVIKLIVNAYGFKDEAEEKSDADLPFTDVDAIDPDAVGYIAIALEKNIITGMPNGTFQPNKSVTRAEIAVMLGLADEEITVPVQKQSKVEGTVTDIVYSSDSEYMGSITIKDDDEETYKIDEDALIYVNDKESDFESIKVGAKVELVLNENDVVIFIEVKPFSVRGVLKSIDGDTIVLNAVSDGSKQTEASYTVNEKTAIFLNGKKATLESLQIGSILKLTLNADSTVQTIKATYLPKKEEKIEEKILKEMEKDKLEKEETTVEDIENDKVKDKNDKTDKEDKTVKEDKTDKAEEN